MAPNQNNNHLSRYRRLSGYITINILITFLFLFVSCKKEKEITPSNISAAKNNSTPLSGNTNESSTSVCGTPVSSILYAGQTIISGSVTVSNDQENMYVTFTTIEGWYFTHTHLYVGALENTPLNNSGNPQVGLFPYQTSHSSGITKFTYVIPYKELPACLIVAAHAEVQKRDLNGNILQTETGWGNGSRFTEKGNWAMYMNYCIQACQATCTIQPGDFHTQTQGAWGAAPNGNNWGAYLHQHFTSTFPSGVTIGSLYTATFTSPDDITIFLPQGGPPQNLTNNYMNPENLGNVFAGQVLTLTLSIGFAKYNPDFQKSPVPLEDLKVKEGTFAGRSVKEILDEANQVLGGASQTHSAAEMNAIVTYINENFDNGTINKEFLICP